MNPDDPSVIVGVVGVCGSGKSTLAAGLRRYGVNIRHIAQEHSFVATMWERIVHPDVLIFLDASFPETVRRRKLNWSMEEYQEQLFRLRHAREHADFYLFTDPLDPEGVLQEVLRFLQERGIVFH